MPANIPAAKKKQYDDLYEGPATITSTDATDLRFTGSSPTANAARRTTSARSRRT